MSITNYFRARCAPLFAAAALLTLIPGFGGALAASTDLAAEPLITMQQVRAKPNIMFILDSSGSMASEYMPDDMRNTGRYGYWSSQCNGLAYNPNITYLPPVDSSGTAYSNSSFAAAWDDGYDRSTTTNLAYGTYRMNVDTSAAVSTGTGSKTFNISGSTENLTSSTFAPGAPIQLYYSGGRRGPTYSMTGVVSTWTQSSSSSGTLVVTVASSSGSGSSSNWDIYGGPSYYSYSGSKPAMNWTYAGSSGNVVTSTDFYKECMSSIGSTPGSNVFNKVYVTSASSDAANYANWYSYYRTRLLLMRTAAGRAFSPLDSGYRVGFTTIKDTSAVDGTNYFRDVKAFDSTQKSNFYSSLYGVDSGNYTPLRAALSKVGRYYAKKISGQTYDPMEYACQRNFAILSTDGYWNTDIEDSANGFGPLMLDGRTSVGNQDGTEVRPMFDGAATAVTTTTPTTTVVRKQTDTVKTTPTKSYSRYVWVYGSTRSNGNYRYGVRAQSRTESSVVTTSVVTETTTVTNRVVVTVNGTVTSDTSSVISSNTAQIGSTTTSTTTKTGTWSNTGNSSNIDISSALSLGTGTYYSASCSSSFTTAAAKTACGFSADSDAVTGVATTLTGQTTTTNTTSSTLSTVSTDGTPSSTSSPVGGSSDSLADVAEYYYATDLRTSALGNCTSTTSGSSQDVCANIVPTSGRDTKTSQHMTTFTIGLGVSGTLTYDKNYLTQTSGSYVDLTKGNADWPVPGDGKEAVNIDDLWHAAVDGRGQYYSALNATELANAISGVVNSIMETTGSGSAATTSTLELVSGDNNMVYQGRYTTSTWIGDIKAYTMNGSTGAIATTESWSAQSLLDAVVPSDRKIYFNKSGTLTSFEYANLTTAQKAYFDNLCTQSLVASQCGSLSTANAALANSGTNLVDYLRGVRTYEISNTTNPLFRTRSHVLGDIINSTPVYVGAPLFSYADSGYTAFKAAQSSRTKIVYAGANDGMLHAFNATTGAELWAFVPSAVMSNMYKLANSNYGSNHVYFVDGEVVVGDIYVNNAWKTILVGGFNSGGKGYYALDITTPESPKVLWEFTDTNMGLSFGNPIISKRADGTWVVTFTSGYNNTTGDGDGHLYVLDANAGTNLLDIATGVGSSSAPSGLAKINGWIDDATNNTALRFYGGDLLGNLWRFDIDNLVLPHQKAMLLGKFQTSGAVAQPITIKPRLKLISGYPVIAVGSGRYLGSSDIADTTTQTFAAVKDPLTATGWGVIRNNSTMVQQTLTVSGSSVTSTANVMDWTTNNGWWFDLPNTGERVVVTPAIFSNTLYLATAIPNGDACTSGGSSWLYKVNLLDGTSTGELYSSTEMISGLTVVELAASSTGSEGSDSSQTIGIVIQKSGGGMGVNTDSGGSSGGSVSARRTSWRELAN